MTDKDLKNIKFLKLEIKRTDRGIVPNSHRKQKWGGIQRTADADEGQVEKVANRLLQRKGEIQNREKYIQCMLAECFGIGENE